MRAFLSRMVPGYFRRLYYDLKSPRMVNGYRNANGVFCPRTRYGDSVLFYRRHRITIGDNVFIWHHTILDGTGTLEIGEGCQIGAYVGIFTHSSHVAIRLYGDKFLDVPSPEKKGFIVAPVRIGRYTFIASGSKILHGVTIGEGCIIAANTIVKKDIPDFSIVSGYDGNIVGDTRKVDKAFLRSHPELRETYYNPSLV